MIIGTGDIGSVLKDRKDLIFFASGVSNSSEKRYSEFKRELELLKEQDYSKHLVYFSSLSIYYSDSDYARHKRLMEHYTRYYFDSSTIVRIGNIDFGKNPTTLINYLTRKISNNEPYEVKEVYRHIISKDEFLYWMDLIPVGVKNEMNIPGRRVWVPDLVKEIKTKLYD